MEARKSTGGARPPEPHPRAGAARREGEQRPRAGRAGARDGRGAGPRGGGRPDGRFAALLRGPERPAGDGPARGGHRSAGGPTGEEPAVLRVLRELGERVGADGRGDGDGADRDRPDERREDRLDLAPFQPPPPALQLPPGQPPVTPEATGSAQAHAEAAALADRLVTSLRIGRVGRDGHEVRMKLALRRDADVEVRLRLEGGRLTARLVGEPGHRADAARLADALEHELSARGLELASVEVE